MTDTGPGGELRNTLYKTLTRSGRRMTRARRALYAVAVPLGLVTIRFWWLTCRIRHIEGDEHLTAALAKAPSLVPCYWHQHQLFCARYLLERRSRGLMPGWLISPSVDGELGAMMVKRVGAKAIRGSSSHTGARALRDYYLALVKENISPVVTPDGPKGPRFKFKPGAILLAQMSGRPMLPMAYAASRAWLIQWDRFVIPGALRAHQHRHRGAALCRACARCRRRRSVAAGDGTDAAAFVRTGIRRVVNDSH